MEIKLNIIQFLLNINISIGKRLAFYQAKYTAQEEIKEVVKQQSFDLRGMSNRLKNILIYDEDIINERRSICNECEFKLGANCRKCGCFISAKTRVNTSCPIGKWSKI